MECPICGKPCEDIRIEIVTAPMDDLADYVFKTLVERGFAVNYDDISMILDIVDDYMFSNGEGIDAEDSGFE